MTSTSPSTRSDHNSGGHSERIGDLARENAQVGPWFDRLTRVGYAAKGITYILMGWLALLATAGLGGSMTDQRGAIQYLADQPYGLTLLGLVAFGLAGYALWYVARAVFDLDRKGSDAKGLGSRAIYLGVGASYFLLALGAFRVAFQVGTIGSSSDAATRDWTATFMQLPFGQALVIAGGLVFFVIAGVQFYQAFTASFAKHLDQYEMDDNARTWITRFGRVGLSARGIIFGIIGVFLIFAALHSNPEEARGIGGAMEALAAQPYGLFLAGVVAIGLVAYGIYSLAQAKYLKLSQIQR